jgi:hypothetical protein
MLIGDPVGAGYWSWESGTVDGRVIQGSGGPGPVESWTTGPLNTPTFVMSFASSEALNGTNFFVGSQSTLLRFSTTSHAVSRWKIPVPVDVAQPESFRPPDMRGLHSVIALAGDGAKLTAIAESAAGSVSIFDNSTETFRAVELPANHSARYLAYLSDGTLGVAMYDWSTGTGEPQGILMVPPSGAPFTAVGPSALLAAVGDHFVAGDDTGLYSVSAQGSSARVGTSPADESGQHLWATGDGRLLEPTRTGLIIANVATSSAITVRTPERPCGPRSHPFATHVPLPTDPTVCTPIIEAVAVDHSGNIWFTLNGDTTNVGEIAAGTF